MKKTLLKLTTLLLFAFGAAFSSVSSLSQNDFKIASALTEIKPFAQYEFNDSSKPGKDSSGNGFDLEMAGNHSGSTCAVQSNSYLYVNNPATGTEGAGGCYSVAADGNNLYAPQLGSSGYDFSDMITGSYSISFKAKFDPTVRNPGNYLISFGLYEDCMTVVPYTRKSGNQWITIIEIQFHNSGREGWTHNSETTTSDTGRKIDTVVSKFVIWGLHNDTDAVPSYVNDYKNNWHTYTIVGDAINDRGYLYIDGVNKTLTDAYHKETYTNGVPVPNGIKLTDLSGKTGRSYTFSLGSQMTINKGSGRQYASFSMDYLKIYNCAMSASNVSQLHSSGKAYLDNETGARYITSMSLDKTPSLNITDTNSVSALIASGELPKTVKATLNDSSVVDMPVFWYEDPDDTVKKIHAIPSIGKKHNIKDTDEPDFASIEGIFNPGFMKYSLSYNYVVDFTYNASEFVVSNIKIGGTSVSLGSLPYQISYTRGNNTLVTFDVSVLRSHASLDKILYDGINRINDATPDSGKINYSCRVYVSKGADIQLILGIETGKISYRDPKNDASQPYGYSTYTYGGNEDLLDPEVINVQISQNNLYVDGYYLDKACTNRFTKANLNYNNPVDLTLYFKPVYLNDSYTVKAHWNSGGTVSGVNDGDNVFEKDLSNPESLLAKITVTPEEGYLIDSISWNSEIIPIVDNPDTETVEGAKTFIYIEHSITIDTTFNVSFRKLNTYYVNPSFDDTRGSVRRLNYDEHGLPLEDGLFTDPYLEGEEVHIEIAPNDGYTIDSIEWNGHNISLTTEQRVNGYSIGDEELIYANQSYPLIVKFASPKSYNINTNYNSSNGSITGIAESYNLNDYANIKLTPNAGYHIASVQWNSLALDVVTNENGEMTINRTIENNVTLTVNFAQDIYYNVSKTIVGSGTVTGLAASYLEGANLEGVTITASEGYYISQVIWGTVYLPIPDNQVLDISDCVVTSNSNKLIVTFLENPKNVVHISQSGKGTISGQTEYALNETTATFTIVPDAGYSVASIKWNGSDVTDSLNDNVVELGISSESYLVVKFNKDSFGGDSTKDITYSVNDETPQLNIGYVVYGLESNTVFVSNQNYDLYVVAKEGYTLNGINISEGDTYADVTMSNDLYHIALTDLEGNVSFAVSVTNTKQYSATINTDGIVEISGVSSNQNYALNEELDILFSVPVGNVINRIVINDNNLNIPENVSVYRYTLIVEGNFTINALSNAIDSKVLLNTQIGDGGTVSGIDENGYLPGEYAVIHVQADEGYDIVSITFNSTDIDILDKNTFTFSGMINGNNNTVIVSFALKSGVTIDYMSNINNAGTHSDLDIYSIGDKTSIDVIASTGYYINDITWNGVHIEIVDKNKVTIVKVIENAENEINVIFDKYKTYEITCDYNANQGDVAGIKSSYNEGEETDIIISANTGYEIAYIAFNGKEVEFDNTETFILNSIVIDNSSLVVTYKHISTGGVTVSLLVTEGGSVEGIESGFVRDNSEYTLEISADSGYYISNILVNDEEIEFEGRNYAEVDITIEGNTDINVIFAAKTAETVGGCTNTVGGSLIVSGAVLITLVGVLVIRKKKED